LPLLASPDDRRQKIMPRTRTVAMKHKIYGRANPSWEPLPGLFASHENPEKLPFIGSSRARTALPEAPSEGGK
jgi:hypothetical protein